MKQTHRMVRGPAGFTIQVGLDVSLTQAVTGRGGGPLSKNGLIDTGATGTAISVACYAALQPDVSGTTPYNRPGGLQVITQTYAIRLKFEGYTSKNPWFDLAAIVVDPATPGVDVLIGMDVLSQLVLFYEGVSETMVLTY